MCPCVWGKSVHMCLCWWRSLWICAYICQLRTGVKPIHSRRCRGWNEDILKIFHDHWAPQSMHDLWDDSGRKSLKSPPLLPCFHTIQLLGKRASERVDKRWSDGWKSEGTIKIPPLRSSLWLQQPRTQFHQTNHSLCPIRPAHSQMTDNSLWAKEDRERALEIGDWWCLNNSPTLPELKHLLYSHLSHNIHYAS